MIASRLLVVKVRALWIISPDVARRRNSDEVAVGKVFIGVSDKIVVRSRQR